MDQLSIDGLGATPELPLLSPSRLEVTWTLDPYEGEVSCAWAMWGAGDSEATSWGECGAPLASAWQFAEAAWLVHKLREVQRRTVPF